MRKTASFRKGTIEGIIGKRIMLIFAALLFVLLVVFLLVIFFDSVTQETKNLLDITHKAELRFISGVLVGVYAGLVFVILRRQAKILVERNRSVEKQERIEIATKHLEHDNASAHTATFYEFIQLANDNQGEDRTHILNILYAHIRTTTANSSNHKDMKDTKENNEPKKITEEIQGLLDILFKYHDVVRSNVKPNFQKVCFSGADLIGGKLSSVDFSNADLSGVNFDTADLFSANLSGAQLNRASLRKAELANALFFNAILSKADLSGADLSGADLTGADLRLANLSNVQFGGAKYNNNTKFPKWFVLPTVPPDNGNKVQFPNFFLYPQKNKSDA